MYYAERFYFISGPKDDPIDMEKKYLGDFSTYFHGVSGAIYRMGSQRLFIENFKYDGAGPDAFFWVGIQGLRPSEQGILLAHPFRGKFYNYDDYEAPILKKFNGDAKIVLTLPPQVKVQDLKWISVWCRRFSINFGDFIFPNFQENIVGEDLLSAEENSATFPTIFLETGKCCIENTVKNRSFEKIALFALFPSFGPIFASSAQICPI